MNELHKYETYYDKLQPCFGQENVQFYYVDTDSFVLKINTKDIIKYLKNLDDIFDFFNLDENHELFSNKNKKINGKCKIETPKNNWILEFICLRSKTYSFRCNGAKTNKIKGISKSCSKSIIFEDYRKCLDGDEHQRECDNYILKSFDHEIYLQTNS